MIGRVDKVLQKMDRKLYYFVCFAVPCMLAFIFVLLLKKLF